MNNHIRLIAMLMPMLVISSIICPAKAFTQQEATIIVSGADGSVRHAMDELSNFYGNLTEKDRHGAFNDTVKASTQLAFAKSLLDAQKYDEAAEMGYFAWYLAERAVYRIYLSLALLHINVANETLTSMPRGMMKPPNAINNLKKASEIYKHYYSERYFIIEFPGTNQAAEFIDNLREASMNLVQNKDSAVKLADDARKEAIDWTNAQEETRKKDIQSALKVFSIEFSWRALPISLIFVAFIYGIWHF